jgi:hypothetical protein
MSQDNTAGPKTYKKDEIDWVQDINGKWVTIPKHGHDDHAHGASIWNKSLLEMIQTSWVFTVFFGLILLTLVISIMKRVAPDWYEERANVFVETFNQLFGYILCMALLIGVIWFFTKPAKKANH